MEIKTYELTCGYRYQDVLTNLNLSFSTGTFTCILGANGVGKTTLFKTLLGFIPPKTGSITIRGRNLSLMDAKEIAHCISYVPQAKNSAYQYVVSDVVLMGRALHIRKFSGPTPEDHQVVQRVLEQLEIAYLKDKPYSELSGGEQQIVLVARALVQEARFIVMDEPASNLDFENQKKVLDTMKKLLFQDVGIIMSSHSPDHVFYCDADVVLICRDRTVITGHAQKVMTEENLSKVYGVDVRILTNGVGTLHSCCLG